MGDDGVGELEAALAAVRAQLKRGEVVDALGRRGVNSSLALVALDGLAHYLSGDRERAGEDFATVAEEIAHRASIARLSVAPDDTP